MFSRDEVENPSLELMNVLAPFPSNVDASIACNHYGAGFALVVAKNTLDRLGQLTILIAKVIGRRMIVIIVHGV